jgi:hypothetical protein
MSNVIKRLFELGLLHDAEVSSIFIEYEKRYLTLELNDFFANFRETENYPGPLKGRIIFQLFSELEVLLEEGSTKEMHSSLSLFEVDAENQDSFVRFSIKFSPGGHISGLAKEIKIHEPSSNGSI